VNGGADRVGLGFFLVRDVDVDYRAFLDLHGGEGLEDAVFVFAGMVMVLAPQG